MTDGPRGIGDARVAARYAAACKRIEQICSVDRAASVAGVLARLGDVVADQRLAATPGVEVDPSGDLTGLDDEELVEWWTEWCGARTLVHAAAEQGHVVALEWMLMMIGFADRGVAPLFGAELASEIDGLIRAVADGRSRNSDDIDAAVTGESADVQRVGWDSMPFSPRLRSVRPPLR